MACQGRAFTSAKYAAPAPAKHGASCQCATYGGPPPAQLKGNLYVQLTPTRITLAHNGNLTNVAQCRGRSTNRLRQSIPIRFESAAQRVRHTRLAPLRKLQPSPGNIWTTVARSAHALCWWLCGIAMRHRLRIVGFRDPNSIRPIVVFQRKRERVELKKPHGKKIRLWKLVSLGLLGFDLIRD